MNLLTQAWMPVRTVDGGRTWVCPAELSRSDLVAFDAVRADFNGALAQFAIGLLQTTSPAQSAVAWGRLLREPPDQAALRTWFDPHGSAFACDGDGARFMQDFDLRTGDVQGIGALLIEAPGESTEKKNGDLFIKRGQVHGLVSVHPPQPNVLQPKLKSRLKQDAEGGCAQAPGWAVEDGRPSCAWPHG